MPTEIGATSDTDNDGLLHTALVSVVHEADMYSQGTRDREQFVAGVRAVLHRLLHADMPNREFWNDLREESHR